MMKNEREGKGRAKEGVSNKIGRALWGPLDCGWGSKDGGGGLCEEHPWGIREYSPFTVFLWVSSIQTLFSADVNT